jgi:hypothetical protein
MAWPPIILIIAPFIAGVPAAGIIPGVVAAEPPAAGSGAA